MTKRKSTNNDLQNITHQTKDRVTRTPLKMKSEDIICINVKTSISFIINLYVSFVVYPADGSHVYRRQGLYKIIW